MGITELIVLSLGLAMDAFAVSICKGLSMKKMNWKKAIIIGLYFGGFQALMPTIGYFLSKGFESFVTSIDHWIAFILLSIILCISSSFIFRCFFSFSICSKRNFICFNIFSFVFFKFLSFSFPILI